MEHDVPSLPEEIIVKILLRLPTKSLLKFRCVSKSWLFLISSYDFAKAHLKNSNDDRLMFGSKGFSMDLYTWSPQSAADHSAFGGTIYPPLDQNLLVQRVCIDCPLYEPHDVVWFEGSCNGLICLSSSDESLSLWNPTIGKAKKLPNSGTVLDFDYYGIGYGFGYDELIDDYKMVESLSFEPFAGAPTLDIQLKVYSLRANSWKTLLNWPGGHAFGGSGKFLNGAIYWSVHRLDGPIEWVIVSHDLSTYTFSVVHLPHLHNEDNDDVNVDVKVLRGCLEICCERNTHMDIW
ncbi:F-box/kelch-repeat protein At3g23880-like [Henckelia pumila]|uniref:F-box/kelch-repeat protein At3g23880-like n=1 Tax=Henckelia pumila TaxID=405737 RepID=UPI003C6E0337